MPKNAKIRFLGLLKLIKLGQKLCFDAIFSHQTPIFGPSHIGWDVRQWKPVEMFTVFAVSNHKTHKIPP